MFPSWVRKLVVEVVQAMRRVALFVTVR